MVNAKQIAQEILNQLGGNKFLVMTGAKNLMSCEDGSLRFKIGRNSTTANMVKISLDADDTYTMNIFKFSMSRKTFETKEKIIDITSGLYNDQIRTHFENITGLATRI